MVNNNNTEDLYKEKDIVDMWKYPIINSSSVDSKRYVILLVSNSFLADKIYRRIFLFVFKMHLECINNQRY